MRSQIGAISEARSYCDLCTNLYVLGLKGPCVKIDSNVIRNTEKNWGVLISYRKYLFPRLKVLGECFEAKEYVLVE